MSLDNSFASSLSKMESKGPPRKIAASAVEVKNGYKGYIGKDGKLTHVLDSLNCNVKSGTIYTLIGASGCGKTTLLSCITGTKELDSGTVTVFGKTPGTIESGIPGPVLGYMPQEAALYDFMKIGEIFAYYARILGVPASKIKTRTAFLIDFLQLPDTSRLIRNLSGGQLRRVSLSVALIHQPQLLVLDEPTVGIDPLVRKSIWDYLRKLVTTEKTTVIITTHYIEECRGSDAVAVLRKGRIINTEESPTALLNRFNVTSLETAVLKLCEGDQGPEKLETDEFDVEGMTFGPPRKLSTASIYSWADTDGFEPTITGMKARRFSAISRSSSRTNVSNANNAQLKITHVSSWNIVWAIMIREFLRLIRYPPLTVFLLVLPLIQLAFFQSIIGKPPIGEKVSLVSSDLSRLISAKNETVFDYCHNLGENRNCFKSSVSSICTFVEAMGDKYVDWVLVSSIQEGLANVQEGKTKALIEFPQNYSQHFKNRMLLKHFADNETLEESTIRMRVDMTNALSMAILQRRVVDSFFSFAETTVESCNLDKRWAQVPLKFNAIYGHDSDQGWTEFTQSGIIIGVGLIVTAAPAILFVMDARKGLVDRDSVAGVGLKHIFLSSIIGDSLMLIFQITMFNFALSFVYGMVNQGSWFQATFIAYFTAIGGLVIGRTVAFSVSHEVELIFFMIFINLINISCSGFLWPLESIGKWFRVICLSFPTTLPLASLRNVMFKGWGITHEKVLMGFLTPTIYIAICVVIMIFLSKLRK